MRVRTGRKNLRNLYLQIGDEPADTDPCLGMAIDPEVAVILAGVIKGEDADLIGYAITRVAKR